MPDFSAVTASALGFSASGCLVSGEGFADCGSFGSCAAEGWGAAGDGDAAGLAAGAGFPLGAAAGVLAGVCLPAKKAVASSSEANVSLTSTVMSAPVLEWLGEKLKTDANGVHIIGCGDQHLGQPACVLRREIADNAARKRVHVDVRQLQSDPAVVCKSLDMPEIDVLDDVDFHGVSFLDEKENELLLL